MIPNIPPSSTPSLTPAQLNQLAQEVKNPLFFLKPPVPGTPGTGGFNVILFEPPTFDIGRMSNDDIIALISKEIGTVQRELLTTQGKLIELEKKKQSAAHKEAMEKLKKSHDAALKAEKARNDMKIVNWFLLALSIVATVVISIASFGTASAAAAVIGTAVSIALLVAATVPINGKGSMLDNLTNKMGEGLQKVAKAAYKDHIQRTKGIDYDSLSASEKEKIDNEIQQGSQYGALVAIIILQIALTIAITVATRGGGTGTAISNFAKSVSNQGMKAAADFMIKNSDKIARLSTRVTLATQAIKGVTTVGVAGGNINSAILQNEASLSKASADEIRAYVRYLESLLASLQDSLEELVQAEIAQANRIRSILNTQHQANMQIQTNMGTIAA